jgi:hypothetical protein
MICWRCHSNIVNTGSRVPNILDARTWTTRNMIGIDMIQNNRIVQWQNIVYTAEAGIQGLDKFYIYLIFQKMYWKISTPHWKKKFDNRVQLTKYGLCSL